MEICSWRTETMYGDYYQFIEVAWMWSVCAQQLFLLLLCKFPPIIVGIPFPNYVGYDVSLQAFLRKQPFSKNILLLSYSQCVYILSVCLSCIIYYHVCVHVCTQIYMQYLPYPRRTLHIFLKIMCIYIVLYPYPIYVSMLCWWTQTRDMGVP